MRILVIEDDSLKAERISNLVSAELPNAILEVAKSYQGGLKLIEKSGRDLIILDMSLPTFDVDPSRRYGRPRPLGGYDLLRKMRRLSLVIPTIIVTALDNFGTGGSEFTFEELAHKCALEFPDSFVDAVFYNQSTSEWRERLISVLASFRDHQQ